MQPSPKPPVRRRAGFTLVELLIVISIIALLIGLLMPALAAIRTRARKAQVAVDLKALDGALADFKATFGTYPPSSITIHTTAAQWNADPRSKTIIRKFWPQFDFSGSGGLTGGVKHLNAAECLTFFLGGVKDGTGASAAYVGFSKNPARPFVLGGSRTGPFFDFKIDRLVDTDATPDGITEYTDPIPEQTSPYLYFSSYDGAGYRTADLDKDGDLTTTTDKWLTTGIYTQGGSAAWNPKGYQIISPGFDGLYGEGGDYDSDSANTALSGTREAERDNHTNFAPGGLAN